MSKKQQALILSAPLFGDVHPKEQQEFNGFPCSGCQGNGWHWKENKYGDRIKEPCSVCGGTGKLKAVVTIEWKADS
ncbi:hypothetical protein [Bacteroides neonati]|uniref:hypothetical protein n=1 Tax=Bacteroides neonati TaxID=1347393 RepID=UPI0004B8F0F4|nr:hypothetical protein [Bacteroides neonati]